MNEVKPLSPSTVALSLLCIALAVTVVVLVWWYRMHPVVIQQQPLPDGAGGRLRLASELTSIASADSVDHAESGYLLLAAAALSEFPADQPFTNLPTTRPVVPTQGERVAAMQFQLAGLGPVFRQFLRQKYPAWDGSPATVPSKE